MGFAAYSKQQWQDMSDELVLRQIKVTVDQPGFKVSVQAQAQRQSMLVNSYHKKSEVLRLKAIMIIAIADAK